MSGSTVADYDDCILHYAKNAGNPSSVQAIKTACKQKFPKTFDFSELAKAAGIPSWPVVVASPRYRALTNADRIELRLKFIEDVIEPRIHPDFTNEAFTQFAILANSVEPPASTTQIPAPDLKDAPTPLAVGKSQIPMKVDSNVAPANTAPESLPKNGFEIARTNDQRIAPFTIVTRSDEQHFFVKLEDSTTREQVLGVFLRAGESVRTKVPIGTFRLKYASGREWYGEKLLFGPETSYFMADRDFTFRTANGKTSGYTVELFLQPNGNLRTSAINSNQW